MKKLIPVILLLAFSCKKSNDLSGKIEISIRTRTSLTIKNGTPNSIDLLHCILKEEIIAIPNNIMNSFIFFQTTVLQTGQSVTYSASELGFKLETVEKISLYDSTLVLIATN